MKDFNGLRSWQNQFGDTTEYRPYKFKDLYDVTPAILNLERNHKSFMKIWLTGLLNRLKNK